MTSENNQDLLRGVGELIAKTGSEGNKNNSKIVFLVPNYQRGYRWTTDQIKKFINDVMVFNDTISNLNKAISPKDVGKLCYLMQNVSVKKKDGKYILVDGQQRITTTYLLLKYCNEIIPNSISQTYNLYDIEYEKYGYNNIDYLLANNNDNVDSFYLKNAYEDIKNLLGNNLVEIPIIINLFINRVKFIWYELEKDANEKDAFANVNMGKINLEKGELIKALLLQREDYSDETNNAKVINIANEWNRIEEELHNDSFFMFYSNEKKEYSRIETVFDIFGLINKNEGEYTYDCLKGYIIDNKNNGIDIYNIWRNVILYYKYLKDWYTDRKLFHYIGYWIYTQNEAKDLVSVKELINLLKDKDRSKQVKEMEKIIFESLDLDKKGIQDFIDSLGYGKSKDTRKVLLLFNILIVLEDFENERFSFEKYKNDSYDIEHIHPKCDKLTLEVDKIKWIKVVSEMFRNNNNLKNKIPTSNQKEIWQIINEVIDKMNKKEDNIENMIKDNHNLYLKKGKGFETDINDVLNLFASPNFIIDRIGNLVLLNENINRAYGNHVYPIKLEEIKKHNKTTKFIPIATRNVMFKYYSDSKGKARSDSWTDEDAVKYEEAIGCYLEDLKTRVNEYEQREENKNE